MKKYSIDWNLERFKEPLWMTNLCKDGVIGTCWSCIFEVRNNVILLYDSTILLRRGTNAPIITPIGNKTCCAFFLVDDCWRREDKRLGGSCLAHHWIKININQTQQCENKNEGNIFARWPHRVFCHSFAILSHNVKTLNRLRDSMYKMLQQGEKVQS